MKHCPKCREEYEDWVHQCAECDVPLQSGPLKNVCAYCQKESATHETVCPSCGVAFGSRTREEEEDADGKGDPPQRPVDSETVYAGLRELGEPLALAMSRAGIPALTFDVDPLAAGEDEGADTVEVVVPLHLYDAANWFLLGFEAAIFPQAKEDDDAEGCDGCA
ncbi:MAG: hypothetical protein ACYS47_21005 [Planctomycetota bacterium]|jgi:hypothetical protein